MFVLNFKVWGSENLVSKATLYTDTQSSGGESTSDIEARLKIMNPRYRSECVDFETSSSETKTVRFDLPEPVYIEYIHAYTKPYAEAGSCASTMSNRYFHSRKYRISPTDDADHPERKVCGLDTPSFIDFEDAPDITLISPAG